MGVGWHSWVMLSGGLFINYRRDDSAGWAGRLYDRAVTLLGSDRLFVDVETIAPGEDFAEAIEEILDRVETVLVVIGPRWLEVRDGEGRRRIEDPEDYVRREIEGALVRELRVVPVLVGGAAMPSEQELPEKIRALARRNSLALRDTHFVGDVDRLLDVIPPASADMDIESTKFLRGLEHEILEHDRPLDLSIPTETNLDGGETSVPLELAQFVGREQEVRDVSELLKGRRLVTLTGPGGIGKSRLALEVARQLGHVYADGVWRVDLSAVRDADLVPQRLADVMGLLVGRGDAFRTVLQSVAGKRTLFLLDNCEHLIDSTSTIAARMMRALPGVSVMATSREPLRVAGEAVYRVPSLEIPPQSVSPDDAVLYDSVRLFVERASSAGASQIEDHLSAVAELCRELDGLPLAIELAAARTDALSPAEILERIEDRFDLLRNDSSSAPERHRSLQAAMDWSFELLDSESRLLFARISVFEGGFDLVAAETVNGFEPIEPASVANILSGLVAKSMVRATGSQWGTRYLMNETVKRYASRCLEGKEGSAAAREAHASFFSRFARETLEHMPGPNEQAWIYRVKMDLDNLRAAMDWYVESGEAKEAQGLAGSLHLFFLFSMRMTEGLRWVEQALAASAEPSAERAGALLAAGILGNSVRHMTEALDLADGLGMEALLDSALYNDRTARLVFGEDWVEAESLYRRSLESAEARGDEAARAMALVSLGYYALSRSDLDGAFQLMTRSVDAAESSGSIHLQIWSMCGLLSVQRRIPDVEAASHSVAALAEMAEELDGDPLLQAYSLLFQGAFALDQDRFDEATEMIRKAIDLRLSYPEHAEDVGGWSMVLSEGSRLVTGLGDPSLGALLIGAFGALVTEKRYAVRPYQIQWLEAASNLSRMRLGPEEFESNREKGSELSLTEALDQLIESIG